MPIPSYTSGNICELEANLLNAFLSFAIHVFARPASWTISFATKQTSANLLRAYE